MSSACFGENFAYLNVDRERTFARSLSGPCSIGIKKLYWIPRCRNDCGEKLSGVVLNEKSYSVSWLSKPCTK